MALCASQVGKDGMLLNLTNLSTVCHDSLGLPIEDGISTLGIFMAAGEYVVRIVCGFVVLPWIIAIFPLLVTWFTRSFPSLIWDQEKKLPKALPMSVWTVHGKQYDLSSWAKDHPGGEWAINLGRNRDCTGLFESYHVFSDQDKVKKVLARFEIKPQAVGETGPPAAGENSTGLAFRDPFHEDVKQMLREHFRDRSHKMKTWFGCFLVGVWATQIYLAYLFLNGSTIAIVLLPFVSWILACNASHDGSHFAVSSRPWLNSLASYAAMPLTYPSTCWHVQHVVQHHVYTNDVDDVDLYHFLPVCRTARFTKWASQFRLQWLAIFFVLPTSVGHLMFVVPMDLLTGQLDSVTGTKRYEQCQNLDDLVARCRKDIWAELLLCLAWPVLGVYSLGFSTGFTRLFISYGISSYLFILATQGAHLQGQCMIGKEGDYNSWAKRQTATSVNFRPDSLVWQIVTGGLNMQSLHHVVPCVGSSHFIDIYPKYKKVCEKHGVYLKEAGDITEFFWGFIQWVRELAHQECDKKDE